MKTNGYQRPVVREILEGLGKKQKVLRVMVGPRQVGKTTAARQIAEQWDGDVVFAAADGLLPHGPEWIHIQWNLALSKCSPRTRTLLVLDEVQKVAGWSETVKALWDQEQYERKGLDVLLLGSSALLVQKGLGDSLAGRFYLYRCGHWGWAEMEAAFGWTLEEWLYFGGYPGAARFREDEGEWRNYVSDSLVETVISRDVLQLQTINKPALLRHLFGLAVGYPAQIFSYNKMLGQLQEAGNTTTLAHYLRLLESAFVASGLEVYRGGKIVKRGGSPKLVLWNNALVSAYGAMAFETAKRDGARWGRLVENAVGAYLLDRVVRPGHAELFYWRDRDKEVDYVVKTPKGLWGLEVKSGRSGKSEGLGAFLRSYPKARVLVVGTGGMDLETFFKTDPCKWAV
jgi:hypothetical protein